MSGFNAFNIYFPANFIDYFFFNFTDYFGLLTALYMSIYFKLQFLYAIKITTDFFLQKNTRHVLIEVKDVNDNTPQFESKQYSFNVRENLVNCSVGNVSVSTE